MKPAEKSMQRSTAGAPHYLDFLRLSPAAFTFSAILLVGALVTIGVRGFHLGLDFTGGTSVEIQLTQPNSLELLRTTLATAGFPTALAQYAGSSCDVIFRLALRPGLTSDALGQQLLAIVHQQVDPQAILRRLEFVGPNISAELAQSWGLAILASLLAILLYATVRFEWRLATSAVLALAHDVAITLGVLSLLRVEIDLTILAALLSMVGYSLNDTIVVFDRIRENFRTYPWETATIINLSLTQTLSRTLITSATTFMVVAVLFLCGGALLHGFSLVLLVGIAVGTFSSIYVASALALKLGIERQHVLPKVVTRAET